MRVGTERQLRAEALDLGFNRPVPEGHRNKAAFGEELACRCFKLFADDRFFYQMVDWPREFAPGFDVVFLAYHRADVERAQWAVGGDLGLLEPWDVGKPAFCVVVEAKCSSKVGGLRTYLRYHPRRRYRQMSRRWIEEVFSRPNANWMDEMVRRYLANGSLRRCLLVRLVHEKKFLVWEEEDFVSQGIDRD